MSSLAILLIGFSVFSAILIGIIYIRSGNHKDIEFSLPIVFFLLLSLINLQLMHFAYLEFNLDWVHGKLYQAQLFLVAPLFLLFSRPLLQAKQTFAFVHLLHFVPALLVLFLPISVVLSLAFAIGALYLLWLAASIYALRAQRLRFKTELLILSLVLLVAIGVVFLGLGIPEVSEKLFFSLYSIAIGCGFFLVNIVLYLTPQLPIEVLDVARETYITSTLKNVDIKAKLQELDNLMQHERLFENEDLRLSLLAKKLDLSQHQLSEMINSNFGKSFSRYVREQRINAAKQMLIDEPSASVLSVGLSVGFSTQSNFYVAFSEIEGMTPGKFRKIHT